jgi:hypothetical protein
VDQTRLWVDAAEFRGLLAHSRRHGHDPETLCTACLPLLGQAHTLYGGDFMAGFSLPGSAEFERWTTPTAGWRWTRCTSGRTEALRQYRECASRCSNSKFRRFNASIWASHGRSWVSNSVNWTSRWSASRRQTSLGSVIALRVAR